MRAVVVAALALALGGCSFLPDWIGQPEAPPLPGERVAVLSLETTPEPDPRLADVEVRLPAPVRNLAWPQVGGYPDHAMHHLAAEGSLDKLWEADVGYGSSDEKGPLSSPVVARGRVFAMDTQGRVTAYDIDTGTELWRTSVLSDDAEEDAIGGGIGYAGRRLYVDTGVGEVVALDADDGRELWRASVLVPLRAPPTIAEGRVYAVSYDNQLFAFDAEDGRQLWKHAGIAEIAQLLGAPNPAAGAGLVIVAYSSGELFALRADSGRVVWSDILSRTRRVGALASLVDINATPVIDRDRVYAVSHAGRLVALDLRTGNRLWEQRISGVQMPWVAGDFLYVLTTEGDLLCLERRSGRIRWVRPLPRFEDPEERTGAILWSGPTLVSDRLLVVSSRGEALSVSPYTGKVLGRIEVPGGVTLAPVVAEGTVFIYTDGADLVALR